MSCFSCVSFKVEDDELDYDDQEMTKKSIENSVEAKGKPDITIEDNGKEGVEKKGNMARSFTFKELAAATQNFKEANMIGEGGFGSVYKGRLDSGTVVAVKQLNLEGLQGHQEFVVEVLMLSLLHHPNLVN